MSQHFSDSGATQWTEPHWSECICQISTVTAIGTEQNMIISIVYDRTYMPGMKNILNIFSFGSHCNLKVKAEICNQRRHFEP